MSVLRIDTDRYEESAGLAARAGRALADATLSAGTVLARTGGMAGWDVMGSQWANTYDPAARDVFDACQALALASSDTARALTFSAGNYIAAEHIASMGVAPFVAPLLPASVMEGAAPYLPSAAEASPEWPPDGFDIIVGLAGIAWPAGDPCLLNEAGTAWRSLASDVDVIISGPSQQARTMVDGLLAADLTLFRTRTEAVGEAGAVIVETSRDIADRCAALATAVETAHQELRDETVLFLAECAFYATAGAALSFVTLGGSAAISALVGAARTTQMILRVQQIVSHLAATARTMAVVAHRLPGAARLGAALQVLRKTPVALHTAVGAAGRTFAAGAPNTLGAVSKLAPAVRWVRPAVTAGGRLLDSRAVSVALSSPSQFLAGMAGRQMRKQFLGQSAVKGDLMDQVVVSAGRSGLLGLQGAATLSAVRRTVRIKDRVDNAVGLVELPASLRDRYAPSAVGALASGASGPGRLTAVQVPPAYGPRAQPSRDLRTSRPAASQ